jgi:hypothetical protein
MKRNLFVAAMLFAAMLCFAQPLRDALIVTGVLFCEIIPALMLVCFLLAAVVYAAGQMTASEQRARFHGWATSLLIGAITCGVIFVLAPWIITTVFGISSDIWMEYNWSCALGV